MGDCDEGVSVGQSIEEFFVDEVRFEEGGDIRVYVLSGAKQGCDKLEFRFNNDVQLENLIKTAGKNPFDFEIREKFGGGRCRVSSITLLSV